MERSTPPARGTTAELVLHTKVAGHPLRLAAGISGGSWEFSGTLELDPKKPLDLVELLRALFAQARVARFPLAMIPSVTVEAMTARYAAEAFALDGAFTVGGRPLHVVFAALPPGCVVALQFDGEIRLSVDVLRGVVPDMSLSGLRLVYASASIDALSAPIAALLPGSASAKDPKLALAAGISLAARLGTKTNAQDLALDSLAGGAAAVPAGEGRASGDAGGEAPATTDGDGAFRKWFPVDKTFGPLMLRRVGGEWDGKEQRVGVLLDATVDLFGLRVGLAGLKVSLAVKEPAKAPKLGLDGLDVALKRGPVEISGGLLRIEAGGRVEYTGMALIKTDAFSVSGFGSYTVAGTEPSLFIYALLDKDLGGPPCFHVTGLAAGFGYNRALKIPDIEKVREFPLIKAALNPEQFRDVATVASEMAASIPVAVGEYWLAAGVRFTSFQMIESFALVALMFGTETVITGLGLSRLTVPTALTPKGESTTDVAPLETIAVVEVALKIVLRPERGIFTAEARLTPASYVFSKDCHLSGGFAFFLWFKDVPVPGTTEPICAGDFVVTLGGYHPKFSKPDHYPAVPRLALDWQVSSTLKVAGEVYFALTPTCLMAGGRLSAVFQSGNLRAWFDAYAHFFIAWKPVQYDIEVGIRIGVSYRLSVLGVVLPLTTEMSASVHLWGPPFAGKAEIDWTIISFTVYFGESREKPAPVSLKWTEFTTLFLPGGGADALTMAVVRGAVTEVKPGTTGGKGYVVVNPHQALVVVKSAVPCTSIVVNGGAPLAGKISPGIAPMGITTVETSRMDVQVRHAGGHEVRVTVSAVEQNVPSALWGQKPFDPRAPQKPELIADALTGVQLCAAPADHVNEYPVPDLETRYDRPESGHVPWHYRYATATQVYDPATIAGLMNSCRTTGGADVRQERRGLLEALVGARLIDDMPGDVDDAYREMRLQSPPVGCELGMLPVYPKGRF